MRNYLEVELPFIPGLKYQLNTGLRMKLDDRETYRRKDTKSGFENRGWADISNGNSRKTLIENILSYRNNFGLHQIFGTFLYSFENNVNKGGTLAARQFPHDFLTFYAVSQAEIRNPDFSYEENHLISQMARLNYGYDSRYLVTLTARRDGYSGFGENNKWGVFPSVAVGYNMVNETYFPWKNLFNEFKVRASWGLNGNQAVGSYQTIAQMETFNIVSQKETQPGYRPGTLAVDNLGWESSGTINFGLDCGLLEDRFRGELNLYKTRTRDLLLERRISSVHGLSSIIQNTGSTLNKGVEMILTANPIVQKNFSWTTVGNFTWGENRILSLYNEKDENGNELDDVANAWFIGQSIRVNYDWEWLGTWQLNEEEQAAEYNSQPGFVKVRDTDGDGRLTADDRLILGQQDPKWMWGMINTFEYKNWNIQIFVHGMHGHQRLNALMRDNDLREVRNSTTVKNWWTPDNPTNDWVINDYDARIAPGAGEINWYEDAGFIRLKDVSLSYDFSNNLLNKIKLSKWRVYITGRNLYTYTKWTGLDPEVPSTTGVPLQREWVFGIDLEF